MSASVPLPLNQRLDRIGQHIVRARLFLDLWFYFEEQDSRRKIIDTMQEYSEFFRFTPHAYITTYVIYMAAVKPDQLRGLTDMALEITNRLLLARKLQDQYFTELPRKAAEAMMKAL